MPKSKRKTLTPRAWVQREWRRNKKHFFDDAPIKLFSSERGCSAVFVALQSIAFEAHENDDLDAEDDCYNVMYGLAKGRLAYLEAKEEK